MNHTVSSILLLLVLSLEASGAQRVRNRFEDVPEGEQEAITKLAQFLVAKRPDLKKRDAHPKTYGCPAEATLTVSWDKQSVPMPDGTHRHLAVGIFAKKGVTYPATLRLSSASSDPNANDKDGGAVGLAVKVHLPKEVQKKVLPTPGEIFFFEDIAKYYLTQDFIAISAGPDNDHKVREFFVNGPGDYFLFGKAQGIGAAKGAAAAKAALAAGSTPAEAAKIGKETGQAVAMALYLYPTIPAQDAEAAKAVALLKDGNLTDEQLQQIGLEAQINSALALAKTTKPERLREALVLKGLGATKPVDPLIDEYHSFVPMLYGNRQAVKFMFTPCEAVDPKTVETPAEWVEDAQRLSKMTFRHVENQVTCFKMKVQFRVKGMPSVEDAPGAWSSVAAKDVAWSPYIEVATLTIPQKSAFLSEADCETLSFNFSHGTGDFEGIGGVQRTRVDVYTLDANARNRERGLKEYTLQ